MLLIVTVSMIVDLGGRGCINLICILIFYDHILEKTCPFAKTLLLLQGKC